MTKSEVDFTHSQNSPTIFSHWEFGFHWALGISSFTGPLSTARNCVSLSENSVASVTFLMEANKGPGGVYDTIHVNYPTIANPSATLTQIGPLIQQPWDSLVMSRVSTPAVTRITVEHFTWIYPVGYYNNAQRRRRFGFPRRGGTRGSADGVRFELRGVLRS